MNEKRPRFQTLVDRARQEPIPPLDIAGRVVAKIAAVPTVRQPVDWSLWSVAGLSVAAAAVVLLLSFQQGIFLEDPMAEWFRPLIVVMP